MIAFCNIYCTLVSSLFEKDKCEKKKSVKYIDINDKNFFIPNLTNFIKRSLLNYLITT